MYLSRRTIGSKIVASKTRGAPNSKGSPFLNNLDQSWSDTHGVGFILLALDQSDLDNKLWTNILE